MNRKLSGFLSAIITLAIILSSLVGTVYAQTENSYTWGLSGFGTKEEPYQINNFDDLCLFRDNVNSGAPTKGLFFRQCSNIDMMELEWIPIGNGAFPFLGVYDGNGFYIENLKVSPAPSNGNAGFFGYLGGTVANLGIESGSITGTNCGSIAVYAYGSNAAILNCYSKASLYGVNAGGIADYFNGNGNVVASCWFDGNTNASGRAGILSSGGDVKLYHCYTTGNFMAATTDVSSASCGRLDREGLYSEAFLRKLNLSTALTQFFWGNRKNVELLQWELSDQGNIVYSQDKGYISAVAFINYWLMPLAFGLILCAYGIAYFKVGKEEFCRRYWTDINAIAIVSGIVSVFMNLSLAVKGTECWHPGNLTFTLMVTVTFVASAIMLLKHSKLTSTDSCVAVRLFPPFKIHYPIVVAVIFIVVLAIFQFDIVPKYDGGIYYGSLVRGAELFRADLLTYLGALNCWRWMQGLALFILPFELLFPGQMIGVYISNLIIIGVTMMCMYWLLLRVNSGIPPLMAAIGSLILILCPFQLGMFTYFSMDPHTAYFLVWLVCSYKKKSPILVAFSGYVLAFNKVTGLIFYVFFLLTMGLYEVLNTQGNHFFRKVLNWWNWKKVLLWISPVVLFMFTFVYSADLTIQNFYGSYNGSSIGFKDAIGLANTFMQGFVFAFRWVFVVILLAGAITAAVRSQKLRQIVSTEGIWMLAASAVGTLAVFTVLCLHRGDAECPRYTALFNFFYAFAFPTALMVLTSDKNWRQLLTGCMAVLLLTQTYWTIDPSIILTSESIFSGKKEIYKLALSGDDRLSMNLGEDYGPGYEVYGDLYAYNLEHTFYDGLLDEALSQIDPNSQTQILLLDVIYYEMHVIGNRYPIYWDTVHQHRTYDRHGSEVIFLGRFGEVTTERLSEGAVHLDSEFYLLVPGRIDADEAVMHLKEMGYVEASVSRPENRYGSMTVYKFCRADSM